jgi:hypothetical protein
LSQGVIYLAQNDKNPVLTAFSIVYRLKMTADIGVL